MSGKFAQSYDVAYGQTMPRLLGLITACVVLAVAAYWSASQPDPAVWLQEAYVWQSPERSEVRSAMENSAGIFDGFAVLAMEVTWDTRQLRVKEAALDEKIITGKTSLVLRLGQSTAMLDWTPERVKKVAGWVEALAAWKPKEIHLDYDCPARRLEEYRKLMVVWQKSAGKVPLVFTALPSWLDQPAFADMARQNPRYVLQVHALDLPTSPDQPVVLCDPEAARTAVEKANRIGVPFRVALPTYGSEVLFGADGRVLDVVSEDRSNVPVSTVARRQRVMADPMAMASLLATWKTHRPRHLTGILWYRLPVAGDKRNWTMDTLEAVIRARPLQAGMRLLCRSSEGPAHDLVLANAGNIPVPLPAVLSLPPGTQAADGARPYRLSDTGDHMIVDAEAIAWPWLFPGQSVVVGWLRHPSPPSEIPVSPPQ